MDFKFTEEQEALRNEFEDFFSEEEKRAPGGWIGGELSKFESDENWAYHRSVTEKLGKKGWLSLTWPREYGGCGYSPIERLIFDEIRLYHRVPGVDIFGPAIVAYSIIKYGSDELKGEWLPRIARGEIDWCQGWSEPNAGSDLASLTIKATKDGKDYIINGQKIWITGAHYASHIFLLARTDPSSQRHRGLTCFLGEMDKPGIKVQPLLLMNHKHEYNEIFFDDVRIPEKNILGQVNQGWYIIMSGMDFERGVDLGGLKRDLEELVIFCKETVHNGKTLAQQPLVRQKLAEFAIDIEASRQWAYYVAWLQAHGRPSLAEASGSKYFVTELGVRLANAAVEIMGLYGTLKMGSKWAPLHGKFQDCCQSSTALTIAGGTTEMQKNVIAWRGLELPRF